MNFVKEEWLGKWDNFETYFDSEDKNLQRAWESAEAFVQASMAQNPMFAQGAMAFWRRACGTVNEENGVRIGGWEVAAAQENEQSTNPQETAKLQNEQSANPQETAKLKNGQSTGLEKAAAMENEQSALFITWKDCTGKSLGSATYELVQIVEKGLEGAPNFLFCAKDASEDWPFKYLLSMAPMPARKARLSGGFLSHLHFQFAAKKESLLAEDKLRKPYWYATMCDGDGSILERCNIVRGLHKLPAWREEDLI